MGASLSFHHNFEHEQNIVKLRVSSESSVSNVISFISLISVSCAVYVVCFLQFSWSFLSGSKWCQFSIQILNRTDCQFHVFKRSSLIFFAGCVSAVVDHSFSSLHQILNWSPAIRNVTMSMLTVKIIVGTFSGPAVFKSKRTGLPNLHQGRRQKTS